MKQLLLLPLLFVTILSWAQKPGYWQQHADYKIDVSMDVKNYRYSGKQDVVYTNNSPDTLQRVYFHLYNNAFQPGSEMDHRVRTISDPDRRMVTKTQVGDKAVNESRIKNLKPDEIGFLNTSNFMQDGVAANTVVKGTVLEVILAKPIMPNGKTTFKFDFEGQVPMQIRRSGRNNSEGVELSMSQWYPKMAEYDFEGWHADPYIAREFHGVWGNFDVKITIDKEYTIGGTGYLQNPNDIGHGYQDEGMAIKHARNVKKLTWHFLAPDVHDFTWAADKEYIHDTYDGPNGVKLHFLYKENVKYPENWKRLQPETAKLMKFFNENVGKYPYKQYSVIQGGDGGMEYAMCTLIMGNGDWDGLLGVTAHELAHSWFQFVLATNEAKHYWMDEGFTTFISDLALNEIAEKPVNNPFEGTYSGYISLANSGKELPQTTHADRHEQNRAYSISAYSKGSVFLSQLGYLIGNDKLMASLKRYYDEFKFKHPTPNDFKRVAEKISGAHLDWYLIDWTQTTNTIDYGIKNVAETANETNVTIERIGKTPMPLDILVEFEDGSIESYYIPLRMMHFVKENPYPQISRTVVADWAWAMPEYELLIPRKNVKQIVIDPSGMMADIKRENNNYLKK